MNKDFFVMLNKQCGGITQMTDAETDELATFDTKDAAEDAAKNCVLGDAFGFEIFERGCGV